MEYNLKIEFAVEHLDETQYDTFNNAVHDLFDSSPNCTGTGSGLGFGMRDIEGYFNDRDALDKIYLALIELVHAHCIFDYEISAEPIYNNELQ